MSTISERVENLVKNPELYVFGVIAIIVFVLSYLQFGENTALSAIIALIVVTISFMVYSDIRQRRLLRESEGHEVEIMKSKKMEQLRKEQDVGKCISCTAILEASATECPKCGYKVHKYHVE